MSDPAIARFDWADPFALDGQLDGRRLGCAAHAFGYRGHCLTKPRRYSTTFKALREAREAYVHEQLLARSRDASQRALAIAGQSERIAVMRFAGQGHVTAADPYLARSAQARAREQRQASREALAELRPTRREDPCRTPQ